MKKERRSKLLTIVALALTLVALTIGFAAFSATLTISSNATVSPNEEDFKMTIYGLKDEEAAKEIFESAIFDESSLSTTISVPYNDNLEETNGTIAQINNATHTINNISVGLTKPGNELQYYFVVKNEGQYDAYLDLTEYKYENSRQNYVLDPPVTGTCIAGEDTTESLVEATCENVMSTVVIRDEDGDIIATGETMLMVPKGEYIILSYIIEYAEAETLADGPFTVNFPEIKLDFSTAK